MKRNFRDELNQAIDFSSVLTQICAFSSFSCSKEKILNALPQFNKLEEIKKIIIQIRNTRTIELC